MPIVRRLIQVAGIFALLMGLLWIGQGEGWIRWPAQSFMIDRSRWALWGLILASCGAIAILLTRKRR